MNCRKGCSPPRRGGVAAPSRKCCEASLLRRRRGGQSRAGPCDRELHGDARHQPAVGIIRACTLALAVIGIYGVTAYSVAQRTRELGLRTALGPQHLHLLRIVIWDGVRFVVVGIGIGLFASWVFIPRLFFSRLLMNGVQATDPIAFLGAALVVFGAALAASYIPARRATRLDPIAALRYE